MSTTNRPQRRRSLEELERLGDEIFARRVMPAARREDDGKYVVIDVETGEYEIDADSRTAMDRLVARVPTADMWMLRVGRTATERIGGAPWRLEGW